MTMHGYASLRLPPTPPASPSASCSSFFFAAWSYATLGGFVSRTFLADPLTMVEEGWLRRPARLPVRHRDHDLAGDRLVLAALVAVRHPDGAYADRSVSRAVRLVRPLPARLRLHTLLILWAGLGELQKLLVIFIGSVFQIVLMVAVAVSSVRRDLVEAAMTLGARDGGILARVLIPASAPTSPRSFGWCSAGPGPT